MPFELSHVLKNFCHEDDTNIGEEVEDEDAVGMSHVGTGEILASDLFLM